MSLFSLGRVEISTDVAAALAAAGVDPAQYLARHQAGDWGDDPDDSASCDFALRYGHQITSNYMLPDGTNFFIATAADRSTTRVLLVEEYELRDVDTWEGYAIWAGSYDSEKNPLIAVEEPLVDALLVPLFCKTILDVGTGTGRHAVRLARQGAQVTAIDQSPEMLALAQQAAQRSGVIVNLQLGAIEDGLPFAISQFDLVICALMLCHVVDLAQPLREFFRVLKPQGYVLVTDFHPDVIALGWRSSCFQPGITYRLPNNRATRADYLQAVTNAGFTLCTVLDVPMRAVPEGFLSDALRQTDTPLCLIILAQKPAEASE